LLWYIAVHCKYLSVCPLELSSESNDVTQWIVDEEFYKQQTDLLIPHGEYVKAVLY